MVVHLGHTSLTVPTMMRPGWLRTLTLLAPPLPIPLILLDLYNLVFEDISSRVDSNGFKVRVVQYGKECVEDIRFALRKGAGIEGLSVMEDELREEPEEGDEEGHGWNGDGLNEGGVA